MRNIITGFSYKFVCTLCFLIFVFPDFSGAQTITAQHGTMSGGLSFPGYSVDTGWLGSEVGIGIYFRFASSVNGTLAKVNQNGEGAITKNGNERDWNLYFNGSQGNAEMNIGFQSSAQYKITIDFILVNGEYIGNLPLLPNTDLSFNDQKSFTSYLLDSPLTLEGSINNREIINYSFGVDGVLDAHAGFTATGRAFQTLSGNSLNTDKGNFTTEIEKKLKTINSSTYNVGGIHENMHSSLDFSLTPNGKIGVTVLFTDYDVTIPLFDVAVPVDDRNFDTSPNENITFNVPKLDTPVLVSPSNNKYREVLSPDLVWNKVNGTGSYTLLFDTDESFSSPLTITNLTDTVKQVSGLANNVKYFWKVKAQSNIVNASDFSSTFHFTTKLAAPNLYYPSNDTMGIELDPIFTWSKIPGADNYRLEVNTKNDFSGSVVFDSSVTDTAQLVNLNYAKHYYWRVTAFNNEGNASDVSTIFTFSSKTLEKPVASWPSNGTTAYTLKQIISWYINDYIGRPFTFDIQYSTDSTYKSGVTFVRDINDNYLASNLENGGLHYFWRIRSKNINGFYSEWVQTDFVTDKSLLGAPVPILSWPVNNNTVHTQNPLLAWYINSASIGGNIFYDLKIKDVTAGSPDSLIDSINTNNFNLKNLIGGHKYAWSVRSNNTQNQSAFSDPETFVIEAGQGGAPLPVQAWPIDSVIIYTNNPTLTWYLSTPATGTITYRVRVFDVSDGNVEVIDSSNISSNSFTLPVSIIGGHTYSWTVETFNGSIQSGESEKEFFTVDGSSNIAPLPVLSWPIGGVKLFNTNITLNWYLSTPAAGTINFDVELKDSTTGNVFNYISASSYSLKLTDLIPGHFYKWRVKSNNVNSGSYSSFTDYQTFQIDESKIGNPTPVAAWPKKHTTMYSLTPSLCWYLSALPEGDVTFNLEIKPANVTFDGTDLITGINNLSYTASSSLMPGTAYHWRVQLISSTAGASLWSDENTNGGAVFTTYSPEGITVSPLVGGPSEGVTINKSSPILSWFLPTASQVNQTYKVEISQNHDMLNPIIQFKNVKELSKAISSLPAGTYYWRVQAEDAKGNLSSYSPTAEFNISTVTSTEKYENIVPKKFEVLQNFPNPFNPSTTIKFGLPKASTVTVKIYDMLGQEVKSLIDSYKNAGTYSIIWNGDNNSGEKVSSGAYLYRVTAGSNIKTMKLILMK